MRVCGTRATPNGLLTVAGLAVALGAACTNQKTEVAQTCCDQPKFPPGIPAFTVVTDESSGPSDGQDVKFKVALRQRTSRDDIYKSMQFLYRYAMTRRPFEPTNFTGQFYTSEGEAQARSGASAPTKGQSAKTAWPWCSQSRCKKPLTTA
jgi:hypothetical protein